MADLSQRLERTRLVTVVGEGGCGKSRLCIEVGHALLPRFAGGVWLVELAPIAESGRVPQAVAQALGVREDSGRSLEETLRRHLKTREVLLLLDNCEHLIEASAQLAEGLLQSCPKLRVLASSRERLGITGESVFQLACLRNASMAEP